MIQTSEKMRVKFSVGTSQHTLLNLRTEALSLARRLLDGHEEIMLSREMRQCSLDALRSLIRKNEKVLQRFPAGSGHHVRVECMIKALRLCEDTLEETCET